MKEPGSDIKLWQDKMQQLPLKGDEQDMWQNMQKLLDERMPVNFSGNGPASPKNFPGAGTIISVIIIIAAIALLILHFMGVFQPGKQQKMENKINKAQIDSVNAATNKKLNTSPDKLKNAEAKSLTTDSITSSKEESKDEAKEPGVAGHKNAPAISKNLNVNMAVGANTVVSNSSNTDKLKSHHVDSKNPDAYKSGNNNANNKVDNSGRRHANHSAVSGSHNSLNTYLQNNATNNKTGHYFGRQNKHSGYQQNGRKNNADAGFHTPNGNQQDGSNNSDHTVSRRQKPQDTITSLIKTNQLALHNGLLSSNKTDSLTAAPATNNAVNKLAVPKNTVSKNETTKSGKAQNTPVKKQSGNSKFELDLRLGLNTGSGSSTYGGISAGYNITPKLGLLIGADVMPSRTLSGSYSKNNLEYTVDTGKLGKRETGKVIISGSRKLYSIDVPVTAVYKINKMLSIYGGPVLNIPVKAGTEKNITLLTNSNDTSKRQIAPYVTNTAIDNKFNFGFSAGARLNFNRLFISAGYMQDIQTYTISSGLGSNKINGYHTVQFGIGYQLFKSKKTKP